MMPERGAAKQRNSSTPEQERRGATAQFARRFPYGRGRIRVRGFVTRSNFICGKETPEFLLWRFPSLPAAQIFDFHANIFSRNHMQRLRNAEFVAKDHFLSAPDHRAIPLCAVVRLQEFVEIFERQTRLDDRRRYAPSVLQPINIKPIVRMSFRQQFLKPCVSTVFSRKLVHMRSIWGWNKANQTAAQSVPFIRLRATSPSKGLRPRIMLRVGNIGTRKGRLAPILGVSAACYLVCRQAGRTQGTWCVEALADHAAGETVDTALASSDQKKPSSLRSGFPFDLEWRGSPMSRYRVPPAANDEGKSPQIRVEGLESPPLYVAEVEIFDALISNISGLVETNDNQPPPVKENTP
ncbi:MAG: hypothetical protein ACOZAA_17760 [Pseudomonadota bacterium]